MLSSGADVVGRVPLVSERVELGANVRMKLCAWHDIKCECIDPFEGPVILNCVLRRDC